MCCPKLEPVRGEKKIQAAPTKQKLSKDSFQVFWQAPRPPPPQEDWCRLLSLAPYWNIFQLAHSYVPDSKRNSANDFSMVWYKHFQPTYHKCVSRRRRDAPPGPYKLGSSSYSIDFRPRPLRRHTPPRVREGNIRNSYPGNVLYPYKLPEEVGNIKPVFPVFKLPNFNLPTTFPRRSLKYCVYD